MAGNSGNGTLKPVVEPLDERDVEPKSSIKRLGSNRKIPQFNNIRTQLQEQSRLLEARAEAASGVATELQDYYRRRSELEHDYARALEKLVRVAQQRNKEHRHKREHWPLTGAYGCWQTVLENTRSLSRDHHRLGDLYSDTLAPKMRNCSDDAVRLHRKVKDIVLDRHDDVGGSLTQAATLGKQRSSTSSDWRVTANKLRVAYDQHQRVVNAEPTRPKKVKALDKELDKRRQRHAEARAKALRARFDYVLCLESANATLFRFYLDDITDVIMCMEVGYNECVGRVLKTAAEADKERAKALVTAAQSLIGCVTSLDAGAERQRFVDEHTQVFALPRRILYQGASPEQEDADISSTLGDAAREDNRKMNEVLGRELAVRLAQLESNARHLKAECRELGKTLDAAEAELLAQMEGPLEQWSVAGLFGGGSVRPAICALVDNLEARHEQEDYYLQKFRNYVASCGRLARLSSKAAVIRRLIPDIAPALLPPPPDTSGEPAAPSDSRRCRNNGSGRGQFAQPLEEHLAATKRDLPLVLTSCIRVISNYGLCHQGIFRVSGSQVEMQALRAAFERGEDPLADVRDASDINSVAGLLKLYLRELRPPILPPTMLDRMLRIAVITAEDEFIENMRELVLTLPRPAMLVLRYLFSFLSHLAEFSDKNMMDEWNLAICIGPTLLAAWGDNATGAQVNIRVTTQNIINELMKRTIQLHYDVFPQHISPHAVYTSRPYRVLEAGAAAMYEDDDDDGADECEGAVGGILTNQSGHLSDYVYDDDALFADDIVGEEDESLEWQERDERPDRKRTPRPESEERRNEPVPSTSQVLNTGPPVPPERTSASLGCRLAEATPDLVLDLPSGSPSAPPPTAASPAPSTAPASPELEPSADTADTFLQNRDTLKKRPRHSKTSSGDSGTENGTVEEEEKPTQPVDLETKDKVPSATGSPVPARNTARVAAKFAELTLTGGSLKPSLAAKPALMRRPTPHPQTPNSKQEPPT